jgi:outer membrane lipoprotein SlyB
MAWETAKKELYSLGLRRVSCFVVANGCTIGGAFIGTCILPGIGTIVGTVIGAIVGFVSAYLIDKAINKSFKSKELK